MSEEEMNRITNDPNSTSADYERLRLALIAQIDEIIGISDENQDGIEPVISYKWVSGWQSLNSIDPNLNDLKVHYSLKADEEALCKELKVVAKLGEELTFIERHGHQCRAFGLLMPEEDTYDSVRINFVELIDHSDKSQIIANPTIAQLREYFRGCQKSFSTSDNFYKLYCPIFFFLPSDKLFDIQHSV